MLYEHNLYYSSFLVLKLILFNFYFVCVFHLSSLKTNYGNDDQYHRLISYLRVPVLNQYRKRKKTV